MSEFKVELVEKLPMGIRQSVGKMAPESREAFFQDFNEKMKTSIVAYLFWWVGLHYFYLKRPGLGVVYIISIVFFVGVIWYIVDIFRIPGMVRDYNETIARNLLNDISLYVA